jgi:hypothetical protein
VPSLHFQGLAPASRGHGDDGAERAGGHFAS